jgi:hypothetical protein
MSNLQRHTEHDQDWIICLDCGASWSVVVCEIDGENHEDVEEIDAGDESCEEHDTEQSLHRLDNPFVFDCQEDHIDLLIEPYFGDDA